MSLIFALLSVMALIGWVWITIWAFTDNVLWGIGCFLIPFCALVYGVLKFEDLKVPVILYIAGGICRILYMVIS